MKHQAWPRARTRALVVRELDDEVLVYDLDRHRAHCLAAAMAATWRECDGASSPDAIAARLRARGLQADTDLVVISLRRLARARLLEPAPRLPVPAPARREWIKRAAVAGFTLLSIEAPTAAQAATTITSQQCAQINQNDPGGCPNVACSDVPGKRCRKQSSGTNCACF